MEATLELAGLVVRCCELRCTQEQRLAMRIHGAATELEVVAKVMAVAAEVASPKPKRQTLWCVNAQGGNVKIARVAKAIQRPRFLCRGRSRQREPSTARTWRRVISRQLLHVVHFATNFF